MTDKYAVVGNPIDFSRSPFLRGEFARSVDHALAYTKVLGHSGRR